MPWHDHIWTAPNYRRSLKASFILQTLMISWIYRKWDRSWHHDGQIDQVSSSLRLVAQVFDTMAYALSLLLIFLVARTTASRSHQARVQADKRSTARIKGSDRQRYNWWTWRGKSKERKKEKEGEVLGIPSGLGNSLHFFVSSLVTFEAGEVAQCCFPTVNPVLS